MGSRYESVETAEVCPTGQLAWPGRPSALAPLWVQVLSQEVHPTVVVGVSVGEGIFAAGLSGGWRNCWPVSPSGGPLGAECSTFHGFMGHRVTPTLRKAALVPEAFPAGGDGLFPTPGPPRLREASSEVVPDGVDGRGGPAPGHLCPGGSGRPREPVSVASAVGPGNGASWSHPASVGPATSPAGNTVGGGSPETVALVLQRKFGEARTTRRKQALLRGLVYNLRRAVAVLWVHRLFPVGRRPLKMLTASPLP
jgi:hypothetical protein